MTSDERIALFEKMPVKRAVIRQIVPAIASQLIMVIYNLADTYFVGLLNSPAQTAAVTIAAPSLVLLTAVSNLFGVGAASLIARRLGAHNESDASEISSVAFWWGLFASLAVSAAFILLSSPILRLCGADETTFSYCSAYAKWTVIIGAPFSIISMLLANLVRSEGSAGKASLGLSLGAVINILLDPLFVLPSFLGLGVEGAGIATAVSNAISTVYFLVIILRRRSGRILTLNPKHLNRTKAHMRQILSIGFPSAVQQGLTVVAVAAQSHFVSAYATEAIAALGIVKKIDQLPLFFSIGVANGLLPLLAYNHSSGDHKRRSAAFRFGITVSVGFALLCVALYESLAPQLTALFIDDTMTISYASGFLRRMVLAMPLMAISYPLIVQFQAMGKAKQSLIASILRKGVLDIPLLFIMDSLYPLYGCMWVQPIVDSISLAAALYMYYRLKRRNFK